VANDNVPVSRRRIVLAVVAVFVILAAAISLSPARLIEANVDGPPVKVEVVGVAQIFVPCPDTKTTWCRSCA